MYAILVIDEQETRKCSSHDWTAFLETAKRATEQNKQTQILGGNCWLIPLESEAHVFVEIASSARSRGMEYKATFLEKDFVWFSSKDTPS